MKPNRFFEINKTDNPLVRLIRGAERGNTQITDVVDAGSGITPDSGDKGNTYFCVYISTCILHSCPPRTI